ncbi:mitochondrial tRNA methylthiotransferase CDK5RAP1-like isoform X1 [Haliotis cracherodii]|uniref:mitochondrial tRNA methylthiotransferase CDK5RAP1-like isoform X1 n=1 Tax=Haliotis cracherodii TaxID=6455 RepID=UPI0039ED8462
MTCGYYTNSLSRIRHLLNLSGFRTKQQCCGMQGRRILYLPRCIHVCQYHSSQLMRHSQKTVSNNNFKSKVETGPGLKDFVTHRSVNPPLQNDCDESIPYVEDTSYSGQNRKVYFETYGCQMNVSDTEVAWSILKKSDFSRADNLKEADVVLVMTCAIREGAEEKIWNRLEYLKTLKTRRGKKAPPMKIGILGCMAERLKSKIVDREKMVDLVCGPDAYRDLPRMLAVTQNNQAAVNVLLSLEETYADVVPVRLNQDSKSAFVSIMRGCDNMCTYCIVPFTRGRERSRPISSILDEVQGLAEQGVREVTLLGQNVNSYRDSSEQTPQIGATQLSAGFRTVYKPRQGGLRFAELLEKVASVDPEMRIRFTSPHPKDFPDEVLHLIQETPNICTQIHLPAQSGNNEVLAAMRRGYTREAYLDLVSHIRSILPGVALTSDFIAGFCGETEAAHHDTLDLIRQVKYNFAYCFPYSMRQKTRAYHRLSDDVPEDVKSRRHMELIGAFRQGAQQLHTAQIGCQQLVLVEGDSKKSVQEFAGRNDANTKVIFPKMDVPSCAGSKQQRVVSPGDYVVVQVTSCSSQVLKGVPLYHSTLQSFHHQNTVTRVQATRT